MTSQAFDIPEPQILLYHPDEGEYTWTHLILFRRFSGSRWLCLKPNGLIDTTDIGAVQMLMLVRSAAFPDAALGTVNEFPVPLTEEDLAGHHQRATTIARLVEPAAPLNPLLRSKSDRSSFFVTPYSSMRVT